MNRMKIVVGKKAYKNKGFLSGIVGTIEERGGTISKYVLVYKDGSANGFNRIEEVTICEL